MQYNNLVGEATNGFAIPARVSYQQQVAAYLAERRHSYDHTLARMEATQTGRIAEAANCLVKALANNGKILVAGNGGSAAEAQHFAAELVGRFQRERSAYAAIALTTDTSALTAIANDYGFDEVFARQVQGLGRAGDVLVLFSTSGKSANLRCALATARVMGIGTIAVTGKPPNPLAREADVAVCVPRSDAAAIQEMHLLIIHLLCSIAEAEMSTRASQQEVQA